VPDAAAVAPDAVSATSTHATPTPAAPATAVSATAPSTAAPATAEGSPAAPAPAPKPRRSLPRKLPLPPAAPFLSTREGWRIMIYAGFLVFFLIVGLVQIMRAQVGQAERLAGEEEESPFPVAKVKPVHDVAPTTTRAASAAPFHGLLDDVVDFEPLEPDFPYATLSDYVQRLTDEEAARIIDPSVTFEGLLARPKALRGRMVKVSGLVIHWTAVRFDPDLKPTTASGEDAFRVTLVDVSGQECWQLDLFEPLPPLELRRTLVEIDAAFLKIVKYESKGGEPRNVPFLVGRKLTIIPEERIERPFRVDVAMAVVCGGLLTLVVMYGALRGQKRGSMPSPVDRLRRRQAPGTPGPTPPADVAGPTDAPPAGAP
jgi:hypothetical protein